jgi:peptidoglycan/LPS O-acetylase OafA/YrhL
VGDQETGGRRGESLSPPLADLGATLARQHLPALDGLRTVAVLTVMAYHAGYDRVPGDLGVTGFFVLSGFLITWLLLRELRASGAISIRAFYVRRTLRIFPAYYLFIAASIAADRVLGDPWSGGEVAAALGYAVNYFHAFHGHTGHAAHTWSLAVEEQFYLLWPAVFLLLARGGPRVLSGGLTGLIVGVFCWRAYLYLARGAPPHYVYNAFDTRFDSLAIGCLLAALAERPAFLARVRVAARWPWLPLITLGLLFSSRTLVSDDYHYAAGFSVDSALVALLIVQLLQLHATPLWSWLERPSVRYLGRISYPLYLWHGWALTLGHKLHMLPLALRFAAGLAASVAVASVSYYCVERPCLALRPRLEAWVKGKRDGRPPGSGRPLA